MVGCKPSGGAELMDLSDLRLGRVMMHDVPRGGAGDDPVLTDRPVTLDAALIGYFTDKLRASLTTRGVDAVADETADPTVRDAVRDILGSGQLVKPSKRVAEHLARIQNGNNPAGLLTIIEATLGDVTAVAIMKLEREQGIRFTIRTKGGRSVVDLQLLRQLTLTNKTKVFKTALLLGNAGDALAMHGRVSDNQRGLADGRGVADFFFRDFLGCELAQNPARATSEFVEAVADFINLDELTAKDKGRYQLALAAELDKNTLDIVPRQFAADYIRREHRRLFNDTLAGAGIDRAAGFQKDPSLIRYENFKMTFEGGMTLFGAGEDLRERVRFHGDSEPPGVDILDTVETLRGR